MGTQVRFIVTTAVRPPEAQKWFPPGTSLCHPPRGDLGAWRPRFSQDPSPGEVTGGNPAPPRGHRVKTTGSRPGSPPRITTPPSGVPRPDQASAPCSAHRTIPRRAAAQLPTTREVDCEPLEQGPLLQRAGCARLLIGCSHSSPSSQRTLLEGVAWPGPRDFAPPRGL